MLVAWCLAVDYRSCAMDIEIPRHGPIQPYSPSNAYLFTLLCSQASTMYYRINDSPISAAHWFIPSRKGFQPITPTAGMKYTHSRILGYSSKQIYSIVANVADYPNFVPYVARARISGNNATLQVGFGLFHETYTSKLQTVPYSLVRASSSSRMFSKLDTTWRFADLPPSIRQTSGLTLVEKNAGSCKVDISVDFAFAGSSLLHNGLSGVIVDTVAKRMVKSFEQRALELYGKPSCRSRIVV